MKKIVIIGAVSIIASMFLVGCGGSSSSNSDKKVGYFIDSAVKGLTYHTTSGYDGVTDSKGEFYYKEGDKVEFRVGKVIVGEATPREDGLVTPNELTNDETKMVLILQTLQALDDDGNPENGITIPKEVINELQNISKDVKLSDLRDEDHLLKVDKHFANWLDKNGDQHIDVASDSAKSHFDHSLNDWRSNHPFNKADSASSDVQKAHNDAHEAHKKVHDEVQDDTKKAHDEVQDDLKKTEKEIDKSIDNAQKQYIPNHKEEQKTQYTHTQAPVQNTKSNANSHNSINNYTKKEWTKLF